MTLFDPDELAHPPGEDGRRVRLTLTYDGTSFHGFALNPGVQTVAGKLTEAASRIVRHPVEITCAGRTDKGVHAHGQVIDFVVRPDTDLDAFVRSMNQLCGPEIAVCDIAPVDGSFSARFDATARRYRYQVLNRPAPDPFLRTTAWHVVQPLDVDLLRLACDPLVGERDFTSFCRRPKRSDGSEASLVRRVTSARWEGPTDEGMLTFWIEASSFCHQMVRSIVGTLVDVGLRRRSPGDIHQILEARNRNAAGAVAPPHGLSLWAVTYGTATR